MERVSVYRTVAIGVVLLLGLSATSSFAASKKASCEERYEKLKEAFLKVVQNEEKFRGVQWGTLKEDVLKAVPDLKLFESEESYTGYYRTDTIDGIECFISYYFLYDTIFCYAVVDFKVGDDEFRVEKQFETLDQGLVDNYGSTIRRKKSKKDSYRHAKWSRLVDIVLVMERRDRPAVFGDQTYDSKLSLRIKYLYGYLGYRLQNSIKSDSRKEVAGEL